MSIAIATNALKNAADYHRKMQTQCDALADLAESIRNATLVPMPVTILAEHLKPFGLCIVHSETVRMAIEAIQDIDGDGLNNYNLDMLLQKLDLSLHPEKL